MQRQPIDVLVDEHLRDEREAELAARDHFVADGRSDELAFARLTRQLLAQVATHDHFGRNQLDHFGDVVADARPLGSAGRACALLCGHDDRVVDAPQVLRCGGPIRGLPRRSGPELGEIVVRRFVVDS